MSKVDVRIDRAGAAALLKSSGVTQDLAKRASRISAKACSDCSPDSMGDPFVALDSPRSDRAGAVVVTATPHGKAANAKRNTLLKSMDAGR